MRITQRSMYRSFVTSMNKNLSDYMESNIQSSSQKRINRPSDDPVGMTRVLAYRASLSRTEQYLDNSKDASAQLASTDSALLQASTILATMLEKANQIATETVTTENRLQAASELRQLFGQLLNLANTNFNGSHLFAGHKTDQPAYQEGLGITTMDENCQNIPWLIEGSADRTIMVRFDKDGTIPPPVENPPLEPDDAGYEEACVTYQYSKDGGKTWVTGTLVPGQNTLELNGVEIRVPEGTTVPVKAYDPSLDTTDENGDITNISRVNGTVLFVRPTAYYMGDDNDPPPLVDAYGPFKSDDTNTKVYGNFSRDVRIRLDDPVTLGAGGKVTYSYSLDNGVTWVTTTADMRADSNTLRLQVPGGYLDVTPQAGDQLEAGQQFVIRPRRADQGIEIAEGEFMSVTNCGKDIFGGVYTPAGSPGPIPAEGGDRNIFEVLSNLIAWAETGPSDGCGDSVAAVRTAIEGLQTSNARVGGKEQRVSLNLTILQSHHDDQTTRMSTIEDADLFELLTRLSQQQLAYQSILQSSSMIMGLSLLNYV